MSTLRFLNKSFRISGTHRNQNFLLTNPTLSTSTFCFLASLAVGWWNKNFTGIFGSTLLGFLRFSQACLTESCSFGYGLENSSVPPAQIRCQSRWWLLKMITSLAVHRTWICTGGYGQHRMNGSIPDQNLRNDVVTPKIVLPFRITYDDGFVWYADAESWFNPLSPKGGVYTRDDTKRRFLAQQRVQMLKQYCSHSKQCNNNVVTLCCAKNRLCESSRVTSP